MPGCFCRSEHRPEASESGAEEPAELSGARIQNEGNAPFRSLSLLHTNKRIKFLLRKILQCLLRKLESPLLKSFSSVCFNYLLQAFFPRHFILRQEFLMCEAFSVQFRLSQLVIIQVGPASSEQTKLSKNPLIQAKFE